MNTFSYIFFIALILNFAIKWWLNLRHQNHVNANKHEVPDAFIDKLTLDDHQKAAEYTIARAKFGRFNLIYDTLILLALTLLGGLGALDDVWAATSLDPVSMGVWFIVSLTTLFFLLDLPVSIYSTFILESKFGFNRTTPKTYIFDRIKATMITAIIGIPFIWLILWIMHESGPNWWLYVWVVMTTFSVFMIWAFPAFIAPLFNKYTPLDDENLKTKIEALLKQCGFKSNGVFVMDGSKRSSHSNAFFTGLGNNKRIVFFDTLLKQLTPEELEAVLAHELGHFKKNHIKKGFALSAVYNLAGLAILGWLISNTWFFESMAIDSGISNHVGLVLFMLITPVFTFLLTPAFSYLSRKHEFEADQYAASVRSSLDLISALVKLNKENASTVTPDPLHSMIYDSHPPASIRINQLYQMQNLKAES